MTLSWSGILLLFVFVAILIAPLLGTERGKKGRIVRDVLPPSQREN